MIKRNIFKDIEGVKSNLCAEAPTNDVLVKISSNSLFSIVNSSCLKNLVAVNIKRPYFFKETRLESYNGKMMLLKFCSLKSRSKKKLQHLSIHLLSPTSAFNDDVNTPIV